MDIHARWARAEHTGSLNLSNMNLTTLPPLPENLRELRCSYNRLVALPVLPASLLLLECAHNELTSLPRLPSFLHTLLCYENRLGSLPVLPDSLLTLNCSGNEVTEITQLPPHLNWFACNDNRLTSVCWIPDSVQSLDLGSNQLKVLPNFPKNLFVLDVSHNLCSDFPAFAPSFGNSLLSVSAHNNPLNTQLSASVGAHGFRRGIPIYHAALRKAARLRAAGRNLVRLQYSLGDAEISHDCLCLVGSYLTGERGDLDRQMAGLRGFYEA